jgi:anaerobic ribonucleoside-triphosphate reductase activating protein
MSLVDDGAISVDDRAMIAEIHAFEPRSRANGPGTRFVVWLQGCSLGCSGCFNPSTHAPGAGRRISVPELAATMRSTSGISGLTLSGGEPMQQPAASLGLLTAAREIGLSTLMFSGYEKSEIEALDLGPQILASLDVLVDGRYRASERLGQSLRGSGNQRVHLLTARHHLAEVEATPVAEVRISADGNVITTGVNPLRLRR